MNFFYLNSENEAVGPIAEEDIPDLFDQGLFGEETLFAAEGGDVWFPLKTMIVKDAPPPPLSAAPPLAKTAPVKIRDLVPTEAAVEIQAHPSAVGFQKSTPQLRRAVPVRVTDAPTYRLPTLHGVPPRGPGLGRLGFFCISILVAVVGAVGLFTLGVGLIFAAVLQKDGNPLDWVNGISAVFYLAFFGIQAVFAIVCYFRSRNIGWSGWIAALVFFFAVPLSSLTWALLLVMPSGYSLTRKLDTTAKVLGSLFAIGFISAILLTIYAVRSDRTPVWPQRDSHVTQLTKQGPSPYPYENEPPPEGVQAVTYPSGDLQLKAWYAKPKNPGKQPALVYYHGGFAFGAEDFEVVRGFLDAGFAVMTPMLRGENGNPGNHELYYGERDDAEAAIRWLKLQSEIDPTRIVTFGHSAGGVLSAMVSFRLENGVLLTGSAGGLYDHSVFKEMDRKKLPFSLYNRLESKLRAPSNNAGFIQIPHVAYVGEEDASVVAGAAVAQRLAEEAQAPLTIVSLEGDHQDMLEPAVEAFLILSKSKVGL